jgi:hypothetical protein
MNWTKASLFCLFGCTLFSTKYALAQDNSPYTRFGLGEISKSENIVNAGMGGITQGFFSPQAINFHNPASYSNLQLVSLDIGFHGTVRKLISSDATSKAGYGTLSYINIGMPLAKNWGLAFGLRPVSRTSYNVLDTRSQTFFDTIQTNVINQFEGNGGTYQVFVGTGVGIGNFSIGVNAGYLFGNIQNSTKSIIDFGSFFYNVGLQQTININKEMELTFGVSGSLEQKLKARRESMQESLLYDASSDEYSTLDTIEYVKGAAGELLYPQQVSGGIMLTKMNKFSIGVDYSVGEWSKFKNYGQADSTQNSWKLAIGGQFIPNAKSLTGYWNKVSYRLGAYMGQDYMKFTNADMSMKGFSFGLGLPTRMQFWSNQFTQINTAFEVAMRGKATEGIKETTYRLSVGFVLSDRWFIKRKYD